MRDDLESWSNSGQVSRPTPTIEGSDLPALSTAASGQTLVGKIVLAEPAQAQNGKSYWAFHTVVKWGDGFFRYRHATFAPMQFSTLATMAGLQPGAKPRDVVGRKVLFQFESKGEYINAIDVRQYTPEPASKPPESTPQPDPTPPAGHPSTEDVPF